MGVQRVTQSNRQLQYRKGLGVPGSGLLKRKDFPKKGKLVPLGDAGPSDATASAPFLLGSPLAGMFDVDGR